MKRRTRTTIRSIMGTAAFAVLFLILSSGAALADGAGNADIQTGQGCMGEAAGIGLNCTANDVRLATATNIVILDDGCALPGDTVTFTADFEVELTAQARHDVGIWFSEDGDPNGDASITGACTVATPAFAPDPPWVDLDQSVAGQEDDTCGDIDANHNPLFPTITLTVTCVDPDGDGLLNLPYCTSWRQPGANDLCASPNQAFPGAPSKCKCDTEFTVDIPVPFSGTIEVVKDVIPASDVGKFDLLVDGNVEADDIGDSGTTGAVSVSAGKSNDPDPIGDTHTVGEAAGTNTDLSRYDTSISCTDGTDTVGPVAGIGPVDVFVEPDDAWVCTITNTLRQGTLIVKKQVINDNGGNATASDFTFSIDAGSAVSFDEAGGGSTDPLTGENSFQVDAGDYTVTEGVVSGYTASDNGNCSPATVVAGETTICEFTNDDDAPSLTLV
ncbi:MAG: hypothetical protein HKO10_02105, partial [Acidimicrobiia bacterium]|nr:hypothetical protein [Acidimicrobiia bacterium]